MTDKRKSRRGLLLAAALVLLSSADALGAMYMVGSGPDTTWSGGYVFMGAQNIVHWSGLEVDWYLNENGAGDGLSYAQTQAAVDAAFDAWEDVTTCDIYFDYKEETSRTWSSDGYNVLYWAESADSAAHAGPLAGSTAKAITVITINSSEEFLDVDIIFDGRDWEWNIDGSDWDIQGIATHEIGHMIGLGHSNVPYVTMWNGLQTPEQLQELDDDDKFGASFLYRGYIIDYCLLPYVYDTYYFDWSLTVMPEQTLTVSAGKSVKFASGKYLYVYGTLDVEGTSGSGVTFTEATANNEWSCIEFKDGSTGTLEYATIKNAYTGVFCRDATVTLTDCTLEDNEYCGLKCLTVSDGQINVEDCTIEEPENGYAVHVSYSGANKVSLDTVHVDGESSSSSGVYLYNSSPELKYCEIEGFPRGIYAITSTPEMENGHNELQDCDYRIYCYDSEPELGSSGNWGRNDFDSASTYDVYAASNCGNIDAYGNWWGEYGYIDSTQIYHANSPTNTVTYDDAQEGPIAKPVGDPLFSEANRLNELGRVKMVQEKDFAGALPDFKEVVSSYPETRAALLSLRHASRCLARLDRSEEALAYLEGVAREHEGTELAAEALYLTMAHLVALGDAREAVAQADAALEADATSQFAQLALLGQVHLYQDVLDDPARAQQALQRIFSEYPDTEIAYAARPLLRGEAPEQPAQPEEEDAEAVAVLSTGPNPFNPYTTLRFALQSPQSVTLAVYDALGQHVAVLADGPRDAGTHTIVWDGRDAHGRALASGVYLVRLETPELALTERMILLK